MPESTAQWNNWIYDDFAKGNYNMKIIYMSPEKFSMSFKTQDLIKDLYDKRLISRFVIDEAHCISKWGHDFWPCYLNLTMLWDMCPNVPITAVTATATKWVVNEIKEILRLRTPCIVWIPLNRPNLSYHIQKYSSHYQIA